jgi:hypothetical protein
MVTLATTSRSDRTWFTPLDLKELREHALCSRGRHLVNQSWSSRLSKSVMPLSAQSHVTRVVVEIHTDFEREDSIYGKQFTLGSLWIQLWSTNSCVFSSRPDLRRISGCQSIHLLCCSPIVQAIKVHSPFGTLDEFTESSIIIHYLWTCIRSEKSCAFLQLAVSSSLHSE